MSYRPIGWDETYETYREKYDHVARSINLVYEAGADAMLEGLRKYNCVIETYTNFPLEISTPVDRPGYLVFIEKEDE